MPGNGSMVHCFAIMIGKHYKLQWQRIKKGLINNFDDFKEIKRSHTDDMKNKLSELAKRQPRYKGRFCNIHDNPELLEEGK